MTNQSQQPLTLKLSNGQEVSIAQAKSVLRHTENGQQRSCAIVRGPAGAAIYNPDGDVQINGAPSSAHWLQPGDTLQIGTSLSASVEQLGFVSEALDSLLNDVQPAVPASEPAQTTPVEEVPSVEVPAAATTAPAAVSSVTDQDTFTPATSAASFVTELQPAPVPVMPAAAEVAAPVTATPDLPTTAADFAIPAAAAATLAAFGVAAIPNEPVATPSEATGFTPATSAVEEPVAASPTAEVASDPPTTGFAAELLARIQADDNDQQQNENVNETVGTPLSETTHSPLAADGHSFSSPTAEPTSLSSLIPELPSTSAFTPALDEQPESQLESLATPASAPVETTTAESAERQTQSSSVSALLERMKDEGQWGGLSEDAASTETPETNETPVLDEADEDVQSYMSQLLSRMRDPDEEEQQQQPAAAPTAAPKPVQPVQEFVEAPKPAGLLKPEEYVPKNKARRLDSLQDMRALANTQTRTAIDRSQAKRLEASTGSFHLTIAVLSCVVAAIAMACNFFGYLTFATAIAIAAIAMISGAFYCCKTFYSELLEAKKNEGSADRQEEAVGAAQEAV